MATIKQCDRCGITSGFVPTTDGIMTRMPSGWQYVACYDLCPYCSRSLENFLRDKQNNNSIADLVT